MSNGWLGVDLFFVLSGFLLSRQLIGEMAHAGRIDIGAFWRRRLLRILPCYLVVILSTWAFLQYGPISGIEVGYLELLVHLFFLQDYAGSALLVPSWSLATELKFYLLLPLLVWLLTSLTWKGAALALVILSLGSATARATVAASSGSVDWVEFFWKARTPFHLAMDGLLIGVCAGYLAEHAPKIPQSAMRVMLLSSLAVVAWVMVTKDWSANPSLDTVAVIWITSILFAIAALSAYDLEAKGNFLVPRAPVTWLARISYPLYLVHYLLLPPALSWAKVLAVGEVQTVFAFWVLYLTTSILVAWALHGIVEVPFLTFRDRGRGATWTLSKRGSAG